MAVRSVLEPSAVLPTADLRVSDLKQWFYCPRVVYWTYCLPVEKKLSYKMKHGAEQHEVLSAFERRRELRAYGVREGQRLFHAPLYSPRLGLGGVLDLLIVTADGQYYPVEFKETMGRIGANHRYQLAGYALLLEDLYSVEVSQGFIYRIPPRQVTSVRLTTTLKGRARKALSGIRQTVDTERIPPPTPQRGKCTDCEYLRYCSDVW